MTASPVNLAGTSAAIAFQPPLDSMTSAVSGCAEFVPASQTPIAVFGCWADAAPPTQANKHAQATPRADSQFILTPARWREIRERNCNTKEDRAERTEWKITRDIC